MIPNIKKLIKSTLNYSTEQCGRCGYKYAWTTDSKYYCDNCGYDSAYSWGTYYPSKKKK